MPDRPVFDYEVTYNTPPELTLDGALDGLRIQVNADLAEGQQLGVAGTPAFFINGQRVSGAQPFAVFQQIIVTLLDSDGY